MGAPNCLSVCSWMCGSDMDGRGRKSVSIKEHGPIIPPVHERMCSISMTSLILHRRHTHTTLILLLRMECKLKFPFLRLCLCACMLKCVRACSSAPSRLLADKHSFWMLSWSAPLCAIHRFNWSYTILHTKTHTAVTHTHSGSFQSL